MIDVLIIAYNHAPYLELAVLSVLAQDRQENINRIIICDDASTDHSRQVIGKLADRYPEKIVPILRDENVGLAKNFRLGLDYCVAPYVAILEGDDVWCSQGKLSAQKASLDNYPNLVAVAHDVIGLGNDEMTAADFNRTPVTGKEELVLLNKQALLLYTQYAFLPSTVMARTIILKHCVIPEFDGLKTMDCAVHWLLSQKGDLGFFHVPMTLHGGHEDSAFSKPNNLLTVYMIQVILRLMPYLNPENTDIATAWLNYYRRGWLGQSNHSVHYPHIETSLNYIYNSGDEKLVEFFLGDSGVLTDHKFLGRTLKCEAEAQAERDILFTISRENLPN